MNDIKDRLTGLTPEQRAALAVRLKKDASSRGRAIQKRPSSAGDPPLSCAQERFWLVDQLDMNVVGQNTAGLMTVYGEFDSARFESALRAVQSRHEILRTAIHAGEQGPVQVIMDHPLLETGYIDFVSASGYPENMVRSADVVMEGGRFVSVSSDREGGGDYIAAELNDIVYREGCRSFDFESGSLVRMLVIRISDEKHYILLVLHHIVFDGGSVGPLMDEVWSAYLQGSSWPGSALPIQYGDYALWQRQMLQMGELGRGLSYWKKVLEGMPQSLDFSMGSREVDKDGSRRISIDVSQGLSGRVQQYAAGIGVTSFHVFLAAYACVISRFSGSSDFAVGIPASLRDRPELQGLIGCFINMLAIRMRLDDSPTFDQFVLRVRDRVLDAMEHVETPFESVVAGVALDRRADSTPLFQCLFSFEREAEEGIREISPGLGVEVREFDLGNSVYDLAMEFHYGEQGVYGWVDYSIARFDESIVTQFISALMTLLEAGICNKGISVDRLPLLTDSEREQVIHGFNATQAEYPRQALIHELFEQQVERTPEAVAVQYEGESLTYAQLNAKANQLAHRLRGLKDASGAALVCPDALVAISVERSLEMVVGLLGILKAGAAYVPVDPEYPEDRIEYMLKDSQAKVLLTQSWLQECLKVAAWGEDAGLGEVLLLDDEVTYAAQPEENVSSDETGQTSSNLAYVIYTSGSTGQPKGVMVEHRGVVNMLLAETRAYRMGSASRVLQFASFSFDACITEIFTAFYGGASLYMASRDALMPGEPLRRFLQQKRITHATLPPVAVSVLGQGAEQELQQLQVLAVVGDVCPVSLARSWSRGRRLINGYGPTEASACSSMYEVDAQRAGTLTTTPIGQPIANARIYILDGQGQPVPIGVSGEIHIGGEGVARGYLNREELTAERFVNDPFSDESGARMYRTGDLGRWRSDGQIEYLGRNDFQVKIRGFRVELGEIEARLAELPEVREVLVLAREDQPGDKRLVAYWTAHEEVAEEALPDVEQLRDHLKAELPAYMVPGAFMKLDAMPLTPNGKVDRKALPAPDAEALVTHVWEAPQGETETVLAGIWQELLGVERVGRHDSFFDLGGHSLLAVQLLSRIRKEFDVEISLKAIMGASTVHELAVMVVDERLGKIQDPEMTDLLKRVESMSDKEILEMLSEVG